MNKSAKTGINTMWIVGRACGVIEENGKAMNYLKQVWALRQNNFIEWELIIEISNSAIRLISNYIDQACDMWFDDDPERIQNVRWELIRNINIILSWNDLLDSLSDEYHFPDEDDVTYSTESLDGKKWYSNEDLADSFHNKSLERGLHKNVADHLNQISCMLHSVWYVNEEYYRDSCSGPWLDNCFLDQCKWMWL